MLKNEHDFESDWWCLAYDAADKLVGFVQSVRFPDSDEGNLANLGVIPEQRGHGYSHDLLAKGTATLLDNVTALSFTYLDRSDNLLPEPVAVDQIRTVLISLTLQRPAGRNGMVSRTYSTRVRCRNL